MLPNHLHHSPYYPEIHAIQIHVVSMPCARSRVARLCVNVSETTKEIHCRSVNQNVSSVMTVPPTLPVSTLSVLILVQEPVVSMPTAQSKITTQSASVMKDTLVILLFSVPWILCPLSLQNQLIPALHHHVDQMLFVKWMEPGLYAHVYQVNLVNLENILPN